MIALNELIEKKTLFEERYNYLGYKNEVEEIINLEKERKVLQLAYEKLRSDTNKLCHELALKKINNRNIDEIYQNIILNEKQLSIHEKKLNELNVIINKKLNKLPNLPDEILLENKLISKNKNSITLNNFKQFLFENTYNENILNLKDKSSLNSKIALKQISNYIFDDNQIINITLKNNRLVILLPHLKYNNFIEKLFEYLKQNSSKFWQIKTSKILTSSTNEYVARLNNATLKIEIKNEYYTRQYKIKYKNKLEDMTRFLKQININFLI